ncbi:MAG: GAF domain-containing protein [Candidatus Saganbacteria bacterium]|nr:GAF domain-containing protein [Candidatus Saganbacteria bacterium]
MDLTIILLAVTIAVNLALGFFILFRDHANIVNRVICTLLFLLSFMTVSILGALNAQSANIMLFWVRLAYFVSSFIPAIFLYFSIVFPKADNVPSQGKGFLIFLPALFFSLVSFTPLIEKEAGFPFSIPPAYGPLMPAFTIFLVVYFLFGFYNLIKKYNQYQGHEKLQIWYVLFGAVMASSIVIFTNIILPQFFNSANFAGVGPASSLIFVGFISYAIVRYRLLDIEDFFSRSMVFLALLIFVGGSLYFFAAEKTRFLLSFYIVLANSLIGFFILFQNFRSRLNRIFFLLIFCLASWVFSLSVFQVTGHLFWGRATYAFISFVPPVFLSFVRIFPKSHEKPHFYEYLLYILGAVFAYLSFTDLIVRDVAVFAWGYNLNLGRIYSLFTLYFLGIMFSSFVYLFLKYKKATGTSRLQFMYVFLGTFLTAAIGITVGIILPIMGFPRFYYLAPPATFIMVGFIAYAIIKHRLMSVELVIQKGFVYTVTSVLIIGLYAMGVYLSEQLLRSTLGYTSVFATAFLVFILAIVFQPLLHFVQAVADRIFLRHRYDYQKSLRTLSRKILGIIRLKELSKLIVSTFVEVMRVSEISFLVLNKDKNCFSAVDLPSITTHGRYKRFDLAADGKLIQSLIATKRILLVDELDDEIYKQESEGQRGAERIGFLNNLLVEIESWGFKMWIPIVLRDELIAVIALGDKLSGDIFTVEDLRLLNTLANQTALALENVRLYQEVLEMKNYNQDVLDSLVYGVLTTDENGKIKSSNPAMQKITGLNNSDLIGSDFNNIFSPRNPLHISIANTLKNKCFFNFDASLVNKKRGLVPIMINTTLLGPMPKKTGMLLAVRDLTEIKELENRARQTDKLKALGTMSAGMAHEIKNPLSSLRILSQLLPIKYEDPEFRKKLLEIVPAEVGRIDRIVESLLRFARTTRMKFITINISDYLDEILRDYLRQAEDNQVKIVKNYAKLPEIMIDRDQLFQVFSNLFVNAIQAMPEGGTLNIMTKIGKQTENFIQGIAIEISDTGHGIAEENLKHLFDPFFTTKHAGTGLGLTIAHNIIDAHQGHIKVTSKVGEGTSFHIYLPVHQ